MEIYRKRTTARRVPMIAHLGSTSITELRRVLHQVNLKINFLHLKMRKKAPMNYDANLA
jgi:signal recognition particle subunit SEC65